MSEILKAIMSDLLAPSVPMKETGLLLGASVLRALLRKRVEAARDIFEAELRRGSAKIEDLPEEELAAVFYRYGRAAVEGEARLNLRLLAAVAAGQASKQGLFADEFLRWANMLSGLRREEVLVLGEFVRQGSATFKAGLSREERDKAAVSLWRATLSGLKDHHEIDEEEAVQICSACTRTGLVAVRAGALNEIVIFGPTELLFRMHRYADIEGVLRRHAAASSMAQS